MIGSTPAPLVGGNYVDWGVISISVTNLAIIIGMIVVFALALVLPFPHRDDSDDDAGPKA